MGTVLIKKIIFWQKKLPGPDKTTPDRIKKC